MSLLRTDLHAYFGNAENWGGLLGFFHLCEGPLSLGGEAVGVWGLDNETQLRLVLLCQERRQRLPAFPEEQKKR